MMPRARRCAHCGEKAAETWDLRPCAIGRWRRIDLCSPCDLELNALVLEFIRLPEGPALIEAYRERKAA